MAAAYLRISSNSIFGGAAPSSMRYAIFSSLFFLTLMIFHAIFFAYMEHDLHRVMVRVDGREGFWREGMMVAYLLKELGDPYPYAVARIRERLISRPDFDRVTIPRDTDYHASTLHSPGSANIKF